MNILWVYNWKFYDGWVVLLSWKKTVWISSERLDRIKSSAWYKIELNKFGDSIATDYDLWEAAIKYCLDYLWVKKIDLLIFLEWNKKYYIKKYNPSKIIQIESHHLAHACSSYFSSTFNESAILVIDWSWIKRNGWINEYSLQSIYLWKWNNITLLKDTIRKWKHKSSIGALYYIITEHLMWLSSEWVTMWLSAYWKKNKKFDNFDFLKIYNWHIYINDIFFKNIKEKDSICLTKRIIRNFFWYSDNDIENMKKDIINSELADISYKLQKEVENAIIYLAKEAYNLTKSKNLCIAWWVWLNCISNKLILDNTSFKNIFIVPPTDDSGIALWCMLYWRNIYYNQESKYIMNNAFLWKIYNNKYINKYINKYSKYTYNIKYTHSIYETVSNLIVKWKIIWWFHWWSESWPRALGHRSIIWDARYINIRDKINTIKRREKWRPLAPSVLEEDASTFFDINHCSRFMLLVAKALKKAIIEIPWALHIDNTARIQTVTSKSSREFYLLLKELKKINNIWVLINTSFNVSWEPIVETPEEAIKLFLSTNLDYLVIGNNLLAKKWIFPEFSFKKTIIEISLEEKLFSQKSIVNLLYKRWISFIIKEQKNILNIKVYFEEKNIWNILITIDNIYTKKIIKFKDINIFFSIKSKKLNNILLILIKNNYHRIYNYLLKR